MEPPRPPSHSSGNVRFPATPAAPKVPSTEMVDILRLFEQAVRSSQSEETIQMAMRATVRIAMNELWNQVLLYARSDLQSARTVVEVCPLSFRRGFLQTLLNFLLQKPQKNSSQAYLTLCEAEKINPVAIRSLLKLILLTPEFTFDYTADIPHLIALLDKGNFTSFDFFYLLCGMRHGLYKKGLEDTLVDKLLASDVIARPEIREYFQKEDAFFRGNRLFWESAGRLKQAGGTPPSPHYAELLLGCFAHCPDPKYAAWLITPFHQTDPYTVGRFACVVVFSNQTEQLVPEVVRRLNYEELFFFLKMKVCSLAEKLLLERIFDQWQLLFMQKDWIVKLENIITLNYQQDHTEIRDSQGRDLTPDTPFLQDHQKSILINWLTLLPQKNWLYLLYKVHGLREFPLLWQLFSPEPQVLMPDSDLITLFRDTVSLWPTMRLPRQITIPDVAIVQNAPLMDQICYALQFPEQCSRPVVDPQRFLDAMGANSQETYGWEELDDGSRLSWSIWLLLHYTNDTAFCTQLSTHLEVLINRLHAIGERDFSLNGKCMLYTQAIQILAAVIQPGVSSELSKGFNDLSHSWLKFFTTRPKTLATNLIPFLISLGQIAKNAPELFDKPIDLNAIHEILESLHVTPEEQLQLNQALAVIRKTPGQNHKTL